MNNPNKVIELQDTRDELKALILIEESPSIKDTLIAVLKSTQEELFREREELMDGSRLIIKNIEVK